MQAEIINCLEQYVDSLMTQSKGQIPVWNVELMRKPGKSRWNYIDGCMLSAFLQLYKATGKEKYLQFTISFVDNLLMEDGSICGFAPESKCLDDILPARVFFPLLDITGHDKYRKGIELVYSSLIKMPRTKEGNFWHKNIYPWQVWLDGMYMAMPFYMMYETRYNGMKNCFDIYSQFINVKRKMRDAKTGLYFHGYDESRKANWADKETGCSHSFWLRAVGWLLMALVDTLDVMDEQIYFEYRRLQAMLRELVDALLVFQHSSGMFYQVIDRGWENGNYLETSGTAMIAYSILKAVRLRLLPVRYTEYGKHAFEGILNRYFENRMNNKSVGGICLTAGLGGPTGRDGTPSYYYSEPVVQNDGKGVAPLLMALAELLQQEEDSEALCEGRLCL